MNTKYFHGNLVISTINENAIDAFKNHKTYIYFCLYFYLFSYLFLKFTIGYSGIEFFTNVPLFLFRSLTIGSTVIAIFLLKLLLIERPKNSPIKFCYQALRRDIFFTDNNWRILIGVSGLSLVIEAFLIVKVSIPLIVPFSYDILFEEIDRLLHFGYQPWELLQPYLGNGWTTLVLHRLYYF